MSNTAGPLILAAFIVALLAVKRHHTGHFNDPHKVRIQLIVRRRRVTHNHPQKIGLALFILYIVQCAFGTFVHFVKSSRRTSRPPQNYVHAILGLAILGLALYQVHLGYTREWPLLVATSVVPHSVSVAWTVWAVVRANGTHSAFLADKTAGRRGSLFCTRSGSCCCRGSCDKNDKGRRSIRWH